MAPGASASKNSAPSESADVKKLSEITPSWLHIPTKYYETLGTNIRGSLFYYIGKDCLEPAQLTFGTAVLNLFQLSAVILDDICDHSVYRRSQLTIHEEHGREKSLVWSFGLCFHIHEYIIKEAPNEEFAWKMIQLYDRMSSLTLEGQYYDMDECNTNFKQIAEGKTAYYTTCFPVAMLALMKTGDLEAAMKVLHNESLLEIGYWFQAENDFKGTFLETNTDIENRTWTLLIQMLAEKYAEGTFEYPATHAESVELYKKYDIYDQYVRTRQAWLKRLKAMSPEKDLAHRPELVDLVQKAKKFSLEYFLMKYILRGYSFKNPDLTAGPETHPQAEAIGREAQAWAAEVFGAANLKQAYGPLGAGAPETAFAIGTEVLARVYGPKGPEWINKTFPFIKEPELMHTIHKLNICALLVEDIIASYPDFIDQLIEMATYELKYPQYEARVVAKQYGVFGPIIQQMFWHICLACRELAKAFGMHVDRGNDFILEWMKGVRDLRAGWEAESIKDMDEYYKLRSTALGARMYYEFGAQYGGGKTENVSTPLLDALCKIYVLQHDLSAYGRQLADAHAKAAASQIAESKGEAPGPPPEPIINAIVLYKKLKIKASKETVDLMDQDIVDELQSDLDGQLKYIEICKAKSTQGGDMEYRSVMQPGMAERIVNVYGKDFVASKNTGWVKLP